MNIIKVLTTACILVSSFAAQAQDKITYPDISYAGTPRTVTLGGLAVSGAEATRTTCSLASPDSLSDNR